MSEDVQLGISRREPQINQGPFLVTALCGTLCIAVALIWIANLWRSNEVRLSYSGSDFSSYIDVVTFLIIGCFLGLYTALRIDYFLNERYFKRGSVSTLMLLPIRVLIFLCGTITTLAVLIAVVSIFFFGRGYHSAPFEESGAYIRIEGPEIVKANESFTLKANLEIKLVEGETDAPFRARIVSKFPDKPTELYASMRLQPGSFLISNPTGGWEKKQLKITSVEYDSSPSTTNDTEPRRPRAIEAEGNWAWVLVPQLDRYGTQQIVLESITHDSQGNPVELIVPQMRVIQVNNPLGIPSWFIYSVSIIGAALTLPFATWIYQEISLRLKERREEARKETGTQGKGRKKKFKRS